MTNNLKDERSSDEPELRRRIKLYILLVAAAIVFILWALIINPFYPVIAWALAITVAAYPMYSRVHSRIKNENLAASLTVALLAVVIVGPIWFVLQEVVRVGAENMDAVISAIEHGKWRERISANSTLGSILRRLDETFNLQRSTQDLLKMARESLPLIFTTSVWSMVELLLIFFTSFFFFRDRKAVLETLREFIPLSKSETAEIFSRVEDTIYVTVYGTLGVAFVQGALGGLMFWWLGLPAPLMWGVVMGLLALVPYLGAFIVWVPAALVLALEGSWGRALVLTLWGGVVVALIDNLLYPILVGQRLRLHTLAVFFFILGGVVFFGASGFVLGPVVLAVGYGVFEICRKHLRA